VLPRPVLDGSITPDVITEIHRTALQRREVARQTCA